VSDADARTMVVNFYRELGREDMDAFSRLLIKSAPWFVIRGGTTSMAAIASDFFRMRAMNLDFSPLLSIPEPEIAVEPKAPPGFPKGGNAGANGREPGDLVLRATLDLPWDTSEQLFGGSEVHWFHIVLRGGGARIAAFATEIK
jgi:hypothetical protein